MHEGVGAGDDSLAGAARWRAVRVGRRGQAAPDNRRAAPEPADPAASSPAAAPRRLRRAKPDASVPRHSTWPQDVSAEDITQLLAQARDGGTARMDAVFEALYPELRRLANTRMAGRESTLTPTVLVHELFLRISQGAPLSVVDRQHFFAASARAMRWILVEHARQRATDKRGGDQVMISLDDQIPDAPQARTSVLALEQCLEALEAISPQRRQIVELRYLAGMEFAQIARLLEVSERTVYREWERARAFLQAMLDEDGRDGGSDGA